MLNSKMVSLKCILSRSLTTYFIYLHFFVFYTGESTIKNSILWNVSKLICFSLHFYGVFCNLFENHKEILT